MNNYFFAILVFSISFSATSQEKNVNLFIGTYTKTCESKGIYLYSFNTDTAETTLKSSTENVVNPSFLTLSPDKKIITALMKMVITAK